MQLGAEGRYQGKLSLVAEVGDVVSPGAPEVGHWFVPVAATKASVRGPGGAWALEKEGLFLCPCLAASRKANQGLRGHWTKCQPTPIGGQLPKDSQPLTQLFPIISFLAVLLRYVTLTSTAEGRSEQPCLVPCSTAGHMHERRAVCFQLLGSWGVKRGWSVMLCRLL